MLLCATVLLFLPHGSVLAQTSQRNQLGFTVVPPYFQLGLNPGEQWSSSIKVVNPNTYPLTLYATVMNFAPVGEEGRGQLEPVAGNGVVDDLAGWIDVQQTPIKLDPQQSKDVPFSVHVPADAQPGGHYAAILIGNQPQTTQVPDSNITVSSYISSLFFLRVNGNVVEAGDIREFMTARQLYQTPAAQFVLRFENSGNVHIQPQGEINIYNMWGKQRGKISVNQKTAFGYVLPQTVRKFVFDWQGESNVFDAGKYKAVATLSFGQQARQNVTYTAYFWVIPVKPLAATLGLFLLLAGLVVWGIKAYIRRALRAETAILAERVPLQTVTAETVTAPLKSRGKRPANATLSEMPVDSSPSTVQSKFLAKPQGWKAVFEKHGLLLAGLGLLLAGLIILGFYLSAALQSSRSYQITVHKNDGTVQVLDEGAGE